MLKGSKKVQLGKTTVGMVMVQVQVRIASDDGKEEQMAHGGKFVGTLQMVEFLTFRSLV